ncbi:unnamed protein product, partial [Owenia fusiformis]
DSGAVRRRFFKYQRKMHFYIKLLILIVVSVTALADNCNFRDPHKRVRDQDKIRGCNRKELWDTNIKNPHKKHLTPHQLSWLNSLSSLKNSHRTGEPGGRAKRQTVRKLRKEYRALSQAERDSYHSAVLQLQSAGNYETFVTAHRAASGAHFGAAFLPFHREFISRFEKALQQINPDISLPYLDSRLDHRLGSEHGFSGLWDDLLMGDHVGVVGSGPFANFPHSCNNNSSPFILRGVCSFVTNGGGRRRTTTLSCSSNEGFYSDAEVNAGKSLSNFADSVWCVDSSFELAHGNVHGLIGGSSGDMTFIGCSPSDPIFFLHHAFVDYIWEKARDNQINKDTDYPRPEDVSSGVRSCFDNDYAWNSAMTPFTDILNIDGIGLQYIPDLYDYADSPGDIENCATSGCNSDYLWCMSNGRCAAKMVNGGECTTGESCLSNNCVQGPKIRGRRRSTCS